MKTLLIAAALLAVTAPAFADATPFLTPHAATPIVAPQREPSRYAPYSRNTPRLPGAPLVNSRQEASRNAAERLAPYSRNYSGLHHASL